MITLVGISHINLDLEKRLPNLLSTVKPKIITLEADERIATEEGLDKFEVDSLRNILLIRKRLKEEGRDREEIKRISNFLLEKLAFNECNLCLEYSKNNNVPLYLIDILGKNENNLLVHISGELVLAYLKEGKGLEELEKNNEEKLKEISELINSSIESQTKYLELCFNENKELGGISLEKLNFGLRNTYMGEKIRGLYKPNYNLIHIGGALHILDDKKNRTLYSRLKDLNPKRVLLN